jgi:hypothetical protein
LQFVDDVAGTCSWRGLGIGMLGTHDSDLVIVVSRVHVRPDVIAARSPVRGEPLVLGVVDGPCLVSEHDRDPVGVDAVGDAQSRVVQLVTGVEQRTVVLRAHQTFARDRIDGLGA